MNQDSTNAEEDNLEINLRYSSTLCSNNQDAVDNTSISKTDDSPNGEDITKTVTPTTDCRANCGTTNCGTKHISLEVTTVDKNSPNAREDNLENNV